MGNIGRRRRRIVVLPSEPVQAPERAPERAPEQQPATDPVRIPEPSQA